MSARRRPTDARRLRGARPLAGLLRRPFRTRRLRSCHHRSPRVPLAPISPGPGSVVENVT